ncbi:MAG: DUF512 domain-containing protein [Lachnospiraceae bacterium]|nr:DUF512 domain-containing protein [Lachnospiraceae bacterium]
MEHRIIKTEEGSIAEELGIGPGDVLVSVNDTPIEDVFDFRMWEDSEELTLLVRKPDGEEWELEIEKDADEELGLVFENDLMSDYRGCTNACIFCFIDQMPPGMRGTLYFKDDDSRLSFLQGNYITLTNMKQEDVDRICRYHMEPMNISVHTTEPELRCMMLHNRFAGEKLKFLQDFYDAGITMNAQIVLCKGVNDGAHLERTVRDLFAYAPCMQSLSVVPVGLTKYREGLYPLEPFTKEDAEHVIDLIETLQREAAERFGLHFVHASDEWYILAERDFPEEERYDGYLQLENGVGMARSLFTDAEAVLEEEDSPHAARRQKSARKTHKKPLFKQATFATGVLAKPLLETVRAMVLKQYGADALPDSRIVAIRNDFFGEQVTVAGLVTGQDLLKQLKGRDLGDVLFLPNVMFRSGEEVFLDDLTKTDVERELQVPVAVLKGGAEALVHALTGTLTEADIDLTHGRYELKDI